MISVLLPVRDAAPYLDACRRSLERQTLTDIEIVAVDDGSGDGSAAALDAWAAQDARVRVIHTPPRGLVAALNTGLDACRGALVARMDADDVAHPRRLELQAAAFAADPALDLCACQVRHFPRQSMSDGLRQYEDWLNGLCTHDELATARFVESPLPHPSVLARAARLRAVGGYRDEGWPEDYDLWLRLAAAGARFGKVRRALLCWRDHGQRLTRVDPRYTRGRFLACKAHHLVHGGPLRDRPPLLLWGAGRTGRRLAGFLAGEGEVPAAWIDVDPDKIGRDLRGARVHAPDDLDALRSAHPGSVLLAAVAYPGARDEIRAHLDAAGLTEGRDYWCAA